MGLCRIECDIMEIGRSRQVLLAILGADEKICWVKPKPRPLEKAAITGWYDDRPGSLFVGVRSSLGVSRFWKAWDLLGKTTKCISRVPGAELRVLVVLMKVHVKLKLAQKIFLVDSIGKQGCSDRQRLQCPTV